MQNLFSTTRPDIRPQPILRLRAIQRLRGVAGGVHIGMLGAKLSALGYFAGPNGLVVPWFTIAASAYPFPKSLHVSS